MEEPKTILPAALTLSQVGSALIVGASVGGSAVAGGDDVGAGADVLAGAQAVTRIAISKSTYNDTALTFILSLLVDLPFPGTWNEACDKQ
jgi:hypothetical protein